MKKPTIYQLLTTPGLSDQVPVSVSSRPALATQFLSDTSLRRINFISEHYLSQSATKVDVAANIKTIINRYSSSKFKVGKTGNPDNRANNYRGYTRMYVLRESTSADLINQLEIDLIKEFRAYEKCKNII